MISARPYISIIVPVHNEVETVAALHEQIRAAIDREYEIVFVDDGSTDGTRDALMQLASSDDRTRVLGFRRNYGKSHALAAGFRQSSGAWIVTIDGDLQDDPREIPKLLAQLDKGYDLVGGWRKNREDGAGKVLGSRVFNAFLRRVSGVRVRDINCGLKAFRREVVEELQMASGYHRFLPLLAHWRGFRTGEVEVVHRPRRHGSSSYGRSKIFRALMDLTVLLFLERFEGRPGRFVVGLGAASLLLGGGVLSGLFVLQRIVGSIQSRFPLLGLGLLLVVLGVQLLSLGFICELISYHFRSRQPREPVLWIGETKVTESTAPEDISR